MDWYMSESPRIGAKPQFYQLYIYIHVLEMDLWSCRATFEACKIKVCLHPVAVCWWIFLTSETWTDSPLAVAVEKTNVWSDDFWLKKIKAPTTERGKWSFIYILRFHVRLKREKGIKKGKLNSVLKFEFVLMETWKAQLEKWNLVVVHSKLSLPHRVRFAVWCLEVESWHWFIPTMGDDHAHNIRGIYAPPFI